ncbi:hypothetical protein CY34DRAFT_16279 [Suillus luteus UH-Slu-Lm8-n1]|uniref:Uncharacterized protein n=1 Tax=Suillus luteus UH-Slu-Lm8-n1 TaxID=930992 RepID=A0A0D0AER6_9AGAM|nr:hypothetical protein CY34DRAFT_16279 [Suillus luteus UH-Slu-Lm8-n1]
MDSASLTNISTIYPHILYEDMDNASLQPMCVTICFPGSFPRQVIQGDVPIRISVSIAEEYGSFTTPVVEVASLDLRRPGGSIHCSDNFSEDMFCDDDISIPFLPLPPTFNYFNRTDWQMVSQKIQEWLTTEVDTRSSLWTWGRDTFWLAFVAAYPSFPSGQWPMWDPRIPLEGEFIEQWLAQSGGDSVGEDSALNEALSVSDIWDDFCKHVALFYPLSLLSSGQTDATN